jgi:flagellum-specific peptidoglycan hydrolase FlgJ
LGRIFFKILIFIVLTPLELESNSYSSFIRDHFEYACEIERECGIPVGLTLCQSIYESGGGTSNLAEHQNNYFGIRTGDGWNGDSNNGFRCYESAHESFLDYGEFMYKYYSHAIGNHPDYYFRNCKGYGAPGYWKRLRVIYYDLNLNFYDDDFKTLKKY